jgi:chromosomal replication initiation ATPase DnaA
MPLFPKDGPFQEVLDLSHSPALARGDFLVSESNREALLWVERWPDWPSHALALWGPRGCGKSHLARIWGEHCNAVLADPCEITGDSVPEILALGRNLVIENITSRTVRPGFEQALFHLFNGSREGGNYLLFCDTDPPARWNVALPDLRSRLAAIPAARIDSPDDSMLLALFAKLFNDRQLKVGPEVAAYLVPRMVRSFAEVSRLCAALDHAALARGGAVTVALAREVLDTSATE